MAETPSTLRWCAGRFVYQRGASAPLHFMEMSDFSIVDGVQMSQIMALRGIRAHGLTIDDDPRFNALIREPSNRHAASLFRALLPAAGSFTAEERHPGTGVLFEFIKSSLGSADMSRVFYRGVGHPGFRGKFIVLHEDDAVPVAYGSVPFDEPAEVVVVNQCERMRQGLPADADLAEAAGGARRILLVAYASADGPARRTTIYQKEVELPSTEQVLAEVSQFAGSVSGTAVVRTEKYGANSIFLPEEGCGPVSILIAGIAPGLGAPQGFRPVDA